MKRRAMIAILTGLSVLILGAAPASASGQQGTFDIDADVSVTCQNEGSYLVRYSFDEDHSYGYFLGAHWFGPTQVTLPGDTVGLTVNTVVGKWFVHGRGLVFRYDTAKAYLDGSCAPWDSPTTPVEAPGCRFVEVLGVQRGDFVTVLASNDNYLSARLVVTIIRNPREGPPRGSEVTKLATWVTGDFGTTFRIASGSPIPPRGSQITAYLYPPRAGDCELLELSLS